MLTIFKYALYLAEVNTMKMPEDAKVLCVQEQGGQPTLWAVVETLNPVKLRDFAIYGTGHPIPENLKLEYVGTVQIDALVWHVFEVL